MSPQIGSWRALCIHIFVNPENSIIFTWIALGSRRAMEVAVAEAAAGVQEAAVAHRLVEGPTLQ